MTNFSSDITSEVVDLATFLLDVLNKANKPLQLDSILRMTNLPRNQKKEIETALQALQQKQLVVRAKGAWVSEQLLKKTTGTFTQQKNGLALVYGEQGQSVVISVQHMQNALHGDTVDVVIFPGKRAGNFEGRVLKVVHRKLEQLPVTVVKKLPDGMWACESINPQIQTLFVVPQPQSAQEIQKGLTLLIKPDHYLGPNLWQAVFLEVLTVDASPTAQEQLGKLNHGIPHVFSAQALAEATKLPESPSTQLEAGRKDLRHLGFVTIDGETAKDFDDAIYVERLTSASKTASGEFRLYVAIADVAHYVHQGSALDKEAFFRGNSYYFPLSVEPMLPEKLSNNLCSLMPHVPRLVMVAEMVFSSSGAQVDAKIYEALIESKGRLTYDLYFAGIEQNEPEALQTLDIHTPMLRTAKELANLLRQKRKAQGNLDFALPEPVILFDAANNITAIQAHYSHAGHQLIESFMLAANECAATFLQKRHIPFLYRTHSAPSEEKLENLMLFLNNMNMFPASFATPLGKKQKKTKTSKAPTPLELQAIINETAKLPTAQTVHRVILRSMMQAKYSPEPEGHYGLASACYGHFTSPIRRYADLTVHRAIKNILRNTPYYTEQELLRIAEHINKTERTAITAEREVNKRLAILFLQDKIGDVFEGTISSVTHFGFFVELNPLPVEGLVPVATLKDDYYQLVPERQMMQGVRTGATYTLGQQVSVILDSVKLEGLFIDLRLSDSSRPVRQAFLPKHAQKKTKN